MDDFEKKILEQMSNWMKYFNDHRDQNIKVERAQNSINALAKRFIEYQAAKGEN